MALIIRLRKGDDVQIGDKARLVLEKIVSPTEIIITVTDEEGVGHSFTITDTMNKEIRKGVRLSLGSTGDYVTSQCVFEAPRDIRIMRGDLLRREPDNVHSPKLCHN